MDQFGNPAVNRQPVHYPEQIDLQSRVININCTYKLEAMIEHLGVVPSMGHYLAFSRQGGGCS